MMTQTARFSDDPNADPNAEMCGNDKTPPDGELRINISIFYPVLFVLAKQLFWGCGTDPVQSELGEILSL